MANNATKKEIIFPKLDLPKLKSKITKVLGSKSVCDKPRKAALKVIRDAYDDARLSMESKFFENPKLVRKVLKTYTEITDDVINLATEIAKSEYRQKFKKEPILITIMAVGGYGRAEMAPYSDIDLLFLLPKKSSIEYQRVIETVLYALWDMKLKIGYAVRSIEECLALGRKDFTIRTALLEHRHLIGDFELSKELKKRLWSNLFQNSGAEFIEAKLKERQIRHAKNGEARYVVEPNVKEGKGGLRDLQTLYWILKYIYKAETPEELIKYDVFTNSEFKAFKQAEEFLWIVRCLLHLIAGRNEEILHFNYQVEISNLLNFRKKGGRESVELFMQTYFLRAKQVGELTRIFLTAMEARHVLNKPNIRNSIRNAFKFAHENAPKGFIFEHGRLNISDPKTFLKDPKNLILLFKHGLEIEMLIHPDALRLVAGNLACVNEKYRKDPETVKIFLELLLNYNNPERALRRMNEVGFLGAFIPEFGRIVAMMQFNMYHSYTVDEHTIQCIINLALIENKKLTEDLPIASEILEKGVNRKVIYLALLLHDIGKGLPEDHSIAGSRIASKVSKRLGLDAAETELIVWLVKNHLLMSDVAQKRDISDPKTVKEFVNIVQSKNRLNLLTVLTVCDIRGVGPQAWNNWKAVLIRQLYRDSIVALEDGNLLSSIESIKTAKDKLKSKLHKNSHKYNKNSFERHYDRFWLGLDTETHVTLFSLINSLNEDQVMSDITTDKSRDATRACFVMNDHPGIFARLAGSIALFGANVVDARTYTTKDGIATSAFWIQNKERKPFENSDTEKLKALIKKSLSGEFVTRDALIKKGKFKDSEKEFKIPTTITFDNNGSDIYTIIEVDTRDRLGLLFDLTRTLSGANISISSAIIATYGEQAVDSFYVKDLVGLKIYSKLRQQQITKKLKDAIEYGAKKAMQ